MKYNKIALIGMMGSGKSTLAGKLSEAVNIKAFDLDSIFEKKYQISIRDFFEKYSEKKFREYESILLNEIAKENSFILSTGGGIILSEQNREILFKTDIYTIFLSADVDTIYERIKNDVSRPLLQVENPKTEIVRILNQRIEYYKMANATIKTDNKTAEEIIKEIQWLL